MKNDSATLRSRLGITLAGARPLVCVQGLGHVGAAMAVATAAARSPDGQPCFDVIGVERSDARGSARARALHAGRFPFASADAGLHDAVRRAHETGNLAATTDARAYGEARVVVVDVHLDVREEDGETHADTSSLEEAVATLAEHVPPGALVVIETTVPPGTCAQVVAPLLEAECARRGLEPNAILLAHSYERVMPGPGYLKSITDYWRVYAGRDDASAATCASFLERVINTREYPLRRLSSMTASETAKVLENSYRAANIAFIDEWGRLAESFGVDLFEVLEAVRDRPTHDNIRQPGFGVGGYCLTKDPLFPLATARSYLPERSLRFPFCEMSVAVNRRMPLASLDRIESMLDCGLRGKTLLLLGVAYRSEVDDTRYAPAESFYHEARARGAEVLCHDPHVRRWEEVELRIEVALPDPGAADVVVFAVPHAFYRELDVAGWLGDARPFVYDCDNVLSRDTRERLRARGCRVESTGRGEGL